jgi:hypothetical protein
MDDDSSEDDQPLVDRPINNKKKQTRPSKKHDREIPIRTGNRYEQPVIPDIRDSPSPTLHSENYKFRGMTQQQEVLLAVMDAQLNELKKKKRNFLIFVKNG